MIFFILKCTCCNNPLARRDARTGEASIVLFSNETLAQIEASNFKDSEGNTLEVWQFEVKLYDSNQSK